MTSFGMQFHAEFHVLASHGRSKEAVMTLFKVISWYLFVVIEKDLKRLRSYLKQTLATTKSYFLTLICFIYL
jgi:hypothetical protein